MKGVSAARSQARAGRPHSGVLPPLGAVSQRGRRPPHAAEPYCVHLNNHTSRRREQVQDLLRHFLRPSRIKYLKYINLKKQYGHSTRGTAMGGQQGRLPGRRGLCRLECGRGPSPRARAVGTGALRACLPASRREGQEATNTGVPWPWLPPRDAGRGPAATTPLRVAARPARLSPGAGARAWGSRTARSRPRRACTAAAARPAGSRRTSPPPSCWQSCSGSSGGSGAARPP